MSDEMGGTAEVSASPETGTDAPAASSPDPSDFDSRLRSDPDFAVRFAKEQQSAATKANDRLRKGDLALQIAERMGNGDLSAGAQAALNDLSLLVSMRQNPAMRAYIERFQSGQPLESSPAHDSGSLYAPESDAHPLEEQLRTLQGNYARLEQTLSQRSAVDAFKSFADTEYGRLLSKDEMAEVFGAWESQVKAWAQTPEGRQKLLNLTPAEVRVIGLNHLDQSGKLFELGERRARQRTDQLRERETDVPDRVASTRAPKQNGSAAISAVDALRQAAAELGVQLPR